MHTITNTIFNDNESTYAPTEEGGNDRPIDSSQPDVPTSIPQTIEEEIGWLDTQQVRGLLKVSPVTLFKWRVKRRLPYSQIGRKIYYKQEDIKNFLNAHYYKPYKI